MREPGITITIYTGPDRESRIAERSAREAQVILGREYGLPVNVIVVPLPLSSEEAKEYGIPVTIVGSRVLAERRAPLISEIVDMVFEVIGEEYGVLGSPLPEIKVGV